MAPGGLSELLSALPGIYTKNLLVGYDTRDDAAVYALDGGPDGLYYFRAIATNWTSLLKQGGFLALECGLGQAEAVREILRDAGFDGIKTHIDTLGIERVIIGTLK